MEIKTTIKILSKDDVDIEQQTFVVVDGKAYASTEPVARRAYINSAEGRTQIAAELPEPYLSAVMAVWGDMPTVEEEVSHDNT